MFYHTYIWKRTCHYNSRRITTGHSQMHTWTERSGILGTHSLLHLLPICGIAINCTVGRSRKGRLKCRIWINIHKYKYIYSYGSYISLRFCNCEYLSQRNIDISNAMEVSTKLRVWAFDVSDWVPADVVYTAVVVENLGSVRSVPVQVCCVCCRKLVCPW